MIAATDTALTMGGFIALASLALGAIGLAINASSKGAETRERLARLEAMLTEHMRNGSRHERKG